VNATGTPTHELQRLWDARYEAGADETWPAEPDAAVIESVRGLTPGLAFDLGAGDGRNAAWLIDEGWRVVAVDVSEVALSRLRARTLGEAHEMVTIHADLRDWRAPAAIADLVVLSFVHVPRPERTGLLRGAVATLRPGGTLVFIAHERRNLLHGVGGPQDPELLPTQTEIRASLTAAGLDLSRCELVRRKVGDNDRAALDLVAVGTRTPVPASG
jgi:SAM-dependent methyltransferase